MNRQKLSLKRPQNPGPPDDPERRRLSELLGFRYVLRGERYIAQALRPVMYPPMDTSDRTWVDIPLVPEKPLK